MKFDLTISLSIIIVFVTAISPIVVTILNNRHQIKLKNIELNSANKKDALDKFIDATLNTANSYGSKLKFYKELNKILIYVDNNSSKKLGKIKFLVEKDEINLKELNSALMDFIMYVNKIQ